MYKRNQSASKLLNSLEYGESSQTISKESTLHNNSGSGEPLTSKVEGDDIVESKSKTFIEKSGRRHGDKYLYDKVIYKNAKTKVIITCRIHGDFEQTPDKHLNTIHCCPTCNDHRRLESLVNIPRFGKPIDSYDDYIKKLHKKFGDTDIKLDGIWNGSRNSIVDVNCKKHGYIRTESKHLLLSARKYLCSKCSDDNRIINKCDSIEYVHKELDSMNSTYTYIFTEKYRTKKDKIKIICPKHGEFTRSVQKLLIGQYCSKCRIDELVKKELLLGGYNEVLFIRKPHLKEKPAFLYYLKINDGEFFKIGISCDPKKRFKSIKHKSKGMVKTIECLNLKKMSSYEAFKSEQEILKNNKNVRVFLNWSTEIFNTNVNDNVLQYFT